MDETNLLSKLNEDSSELVTYFDLVLDEVSLCGHLVIDEWNIQIILVVNE